MPATKRVGQRRSKRKPRAEVPGAKEPMDITPVVPQGRQLITGYGPGLFRIAGTVWRESVIVLPERTLAWPVASFAEIETASFEPLTTAEPGIDVLLLGCGATMQMPPSTLRMALRAAGIVVEPMDTGAACRTFNVLLAEGRRVAAALVML